MNEQKSEIRVILNERGSRYGTLLGNGRVAQRLKETVRSLGSRWNDMPEDQKEAIDNILQKIARTVTGDPFYLDNWIDIIGYAQLVIDAIRERKEQKDDGPTQLYSYKDSVTMPSGLSTGYRVVQLSPPIPRATGPDRQDGDPE